MRVLFAVLAVVLLGAVPRAMAEPISLALSNCTDQTQWAVVFEAADPACVAPHQSAHVSSCETVDFSCEGGCKTTVVGIKDAECGSPRVQFGEMVITNFGISHKSSLLGQTDEQWAALCGCQRDEMNY